MESVLVILPVILTSFISLMTNADQLVIPHSNQPIKTEPTFVTILVTHLEIILWTGTANQLVTRHLSHSQTQLEPIFATILATLLTFIILAMVLVERIVIRRLRHQQMRMEESFANIPVEKMSFEILMGHVQRVNVRITSKSKIILIHLSFNIVIVFLQIHCLEIRRAVMSHLFLL